MLNWRPSCCSGSVHRRWKKMFACGAVRSALRVKRTLHPGQNTSVICQAAYCWKVFHDGASQTFKNSWNQVQTEKTNVFCCSILLQAPTGSFGSKLITLLHSSLNFCANIATDWFPALIINIWYVIFSFLPLTCSRTRPYCLVLFQQEVHPVDPQTAQKQSGPSVVMSKIMDPEKKKKSKAFLEMLSPQRVSLLREYLQMIGHILQGL